MKKQKFLREIVKSPVLLSLTILAISGVVAQWSQALQARYVAVCPQAYHMQVATPASCPKPPSEGGGGTGGSGGDGGDGGNSNPSGGSSVNLDGDSGAKYYCGSGNKAVRVSVNIGCRGKSCNARDNKGSNTGCNPITDATFAIIRFLSIGVGLIIVGSLIVRSMQYTLSRGNPGATAQFATSILHILGALLLYIFGYAILNFLIPKGFFQ